MNRYPGNHMDSGIVTVPRQLKTRPGAPQTHLAYITGDEAKMIQEHKPGTPHEGAAGIPNYDTWGIDTSGNVTGGSTSGGGGSWSGDTGGNQPEPSPWAGNPTHGSGLPGGGNPQNNTNSDLYGGYSTAQEQAAALMAASGQIGGGISGGISTHTPVQYPGWMYTPEGLEELELFGWSDELLPEFQHDGQYSILDPTWEIENQPWEEWAHENDQMGQNHLGYGTVYSPWANNGQGGFIVYDESINLPNQGSGSVAPGGYYGWPGGGNYGGGYGTGLGGIMARRWNTLMKNRGNFNSPMPQYYASLKNPGQPRNQEMFENMMANIYRV